MESPHPSDIADAAAEAQYAQGKLAEAEPLFRESLAAEREVNGNNALSTMQDAGNLGILSGRARGLQALLLLGRRGA